MDQDIVRLLQSIEKLIKGAVGASTPKGTFSSKLSSLKQDRDDKASAKIFRTVASDVKDADKAVLGLTKTIIGLNTAVTSTTKSFGTLQAQMAKFGATLNMPTGTGQVPGVAAAAMGPGPGVFRPVQRTLQQVGAQTQSVMGHMLTRFASAGVTITALEGVMGGLWDVTKRLTSEFFSLSRIGLGSVTALKDMSINAVLAGMSLAEYTKLVTDNTAFASRAGSIENFNQISSASDNMLASMGIFGAEARELQASLANSNTMMGVSQSQLADANREQIKVFDNLRKSTNMTAHEFGELVKVISENEQTQRELVGLGPAEKLARQNELIAINTTGQRLGLTQKASQELAAALIAQRKATVKDRFESAGRIQQLAAFTGQGAQGMRAAELLRKGRKTAGETEELRNLLGGIDSAAQGLYDIGDFSVQNVIDQLGPDNGQGLGAAGDIMKATRAATNAGESGAVFNKDFGQHVGEFGQVVGKLTAWARGFGQSIGPAIASVIGSSMLLFFRGPIVNVLGKALGIGGGAATGGAGMMAGVGNALKGLASPVTNTIKFLGDLGGTFNTVKAGAGTMQAVVKTGTQALGGFMSGMGSIGSALIKVGPLASLVSGVMEMFTGELAKAFDPNGGWLARAQGIVTAAFWAVPQMLVDVLGWVFGEEFMKPIQSVFDTIKVGVVGAINGLLLALTSAVSWLTDLLPKDSGLRKMVDGAKESLAKSLDANATTINELGGLFGSENRKTLKEISDQNSKAANDAEKTSKAAVMKVSDAQDKFNNVQLGAAGTAADVLKDARAIIGQPQVQQQPVVAPAQVNTTETPAAQTPQNQSSIQPVATAPDMLTILNSILQVLQQNLSIEQQHVALSEQLLRQNRPTAGFVPSEVTANRLLKQGHA